MVHKLKVYAKVSVFELFRSDCITLYVVGVSHGHTGHVRFLTGVQMGGERGGVVVRDTDLSLFNEKLYVLGAELLFESLCLSVSKSVTFFFL